jgi:hypothetical protein
MKFGWEDKQNVSLQSAFKKSKSLVLFSFDFLSQNSFPETVKKLKSGNKFWLKYKSLYFCTPLKNGVAKKAKSSLKVWKQQHENLLVRFSNKR